VTASGIPVSPDHFEASSFEKAEPIPDYKIIRFAFALSAVNDAAFAQLVENALRQFIRRMPRRRKM
jgi:hypothetical protein